MYKMGRVQVIEAILICSVFLNIVLISTLYLADDTTDLKLENQKLQLEKIILKREMDKLRQVLQDLKNKNLNVDFSNDNAIVIYYPESEIDECYWNELMEVEDK